MENQIVILCIGTDKMIGDSVGPRVGQNLKTLLKNNQNIKIYGNLKETLNFKNANQTLKKIEQNYKKPFIIAVDAALGTEEMIEKIFISKGPIYIGNSLGHGIKYPSDINIRGIVGKNYNTVQKNIEALLKVSEICVDKMASKITENIKQILEEIKCV